MGLSGQVLSGLDGGFVSETPDRAKLAIGLFAVKILMADSIDLRASSMMAKDLESLSRARRSACTV